MVLHDVCEHFQAGSVTVSEPCQMPPLNLGRYRGLREHSDAHRRGGKALKGWALVRVDVRY
jgi:hypothetical protein